MVAFDLFNTVSDFQRGVRFTMPAVLDVTNVDLAERPLFDRELVTKYREDLGQFEDGLRTRVLEGLKPKSQTQEIRVKMKQVLLGELSNK